MATALVIGGGPAGLMAADILSAGGHAVTVADQMPSLGRKFLMAGKSGLNLTMNAPGGLDLTAYHPLPDALAAALAQFGPQEVMDWTTALGQEHFTGSTGRVFPTAMKASPLLRAWLSRLTAQGVQTRLRWTWSGWEGAKLIFDTPDGVQSLSPDVTVLALGGASWSRLGSDGKWAPIMQDTVPFAPANAALLVPWSDHMKPHFGAALKNVTFTAGGLTSRGEASISRGGLEGGGIYALTRPLRGGAALQVDLLPDRSADWIDAAMAKGRSGDSLSNRLRKVLRLDPVKRALWQEWGDRAATRFGQAIKAVTVPYTGLGPLDAAISTAGGLSFDAVDGNLMLRERPGTFACGEMLNWEAITGGYLITGCLATGRYAGLGACRFLADRT